VFDRNYIRQYAAAAGVSEQHLMDRYSAYQAEKERIASEPERRRREGRPTALRWLASLFALTLRSL
jgi:hypothetical protein